MPDATPTSSLVDLTDLARDVSRGKEPVPIPVVGLSLIQLESLAKLVVSLIHSVGLPLWDLCILSKGEELIEANVIVCRG